MIDNLVKTKYSIKISSTFKRDYKKIIKQGKDKAKLKKIIIKLANGEELEERYKNHRLIEINIIKVVMNAILRNMLMMNFY